VGTAKRLEAMHARNACAKRADATQSPLSANTNRWAQVHPLKRKHMIFVLPKKQYVIEYSLHINAPDKSVWRHITEVDIASFRHPAYFSILGIPKPLRAKIVEPGVGGMRTAYFSNGLSFSQKITEWQPYERYAFTFQADPGFRVAYLLDLSNGPFRIKAGAYQIALDQSGVRLILSTQYELCGIIGVCLRIPVKIVLDLFQRYLLKSIKVNAEQQEITPDKAGEVPHA